MSIVGIYTANELEGDNSVSLTAQTLGSKIDELLGGGSTVLVVSGLLIQLPHKKLNHDNGRLIMQSWAM